MAKFEINKGYQHGHRVVEADRYRLVDGYFNFYDADDNQVASIAASGVQLIERVAG